MDRVVISLQAARRRTVVVALADELDLATIAARRAHVLDSVAAQPRLGRVVIDLDEVSFLAVSGIGMLMDVAALLGERGVRTQVVVASASTRRALRVAGATELLPCFDTVAEALRATPG